MKYRCILIAAVFAAVSSANRFFAAEKPEKMNTEQSIERSTGNGKTASGKSEALFKRLDLSASSALIPRISIKPRRVRPAAYALFSATPTCACTKPYRISHCRILRALPFTLRNTGRRSLFRGPCVFRSRSKRARCRQAEVFRASLPLLRPFPLLRLQHRFRQKRGSLFRFRRRVREANRSPLQPTAAFRIRRRLLPDRALPFFIGKTELLPLRRISASLCRV